MNWPFRRRAGKTAQAGQQPGVPQSDGPDAVPAAAPGPAPAAEPAAWRRLPALTGPLTHAGGAARRLTAASVTDGTVRDAASMLATGAGAATDKPSEVPAGRVEGLAKLAPLRHVQLRLPAEDGGPSAGADAPGVTEGRPAAVPLHPAPAPAGAGPAPAPAVPEPAPQPPAPAPTPAIRRAVPVPSAETPAHLTRVTEDSVGEPRPATVSTHPPTWMSAGAIGPGTDLASLLFPMPGDAPQPFPEGPPAPAPEPRTQAAPTHLSRRRNLGQSRRLGLGPTLSHTPHPDPASSGEEAGGRPPPVAGPLPTAPEAAGTPLGQPAPSAPPQTQAAPDTRHSQTAPAPAPLPVIPTRDAPRRAAGAPLRHRAAPPVTRAPADLARAVSELHGVDVTGTALHTGAEVTRRAAGMAAQAFTKNGQVYLPDTASAPDSPRTRGLIAHELTHVAQQKRYGGSLPPENSPAGRALEAEAISAERFFRGDPGAPAPLVHRRPVTAGPDPEEIRRLIAEMTPAAPPPPPEPEPMPEPEQHGPQAAPEPLPEPAYTGPVGVSWTADASLLEGVQRASREEIIEEYLGELNHLRRIRNQDQAALTPDSLMRNEKWRQVIDWRLKRQFAGGTRDQIIAEVLAEKNYELEKEGSDKKRLTSGDLATNQELQDAVEFRIKEASRRGKLADDQSDDDASDEPLDGHWLKGQVGLAFAEALASPFGITMDRKRRAEVRQFFGGRRKPQEDEDDQGYVFDLGGDQGQQAPADATLVSPPAASPAPTPSRRVADKPAVAQGKGSVNPLAASMGTQASGADQMERSDRALPPWASVFSLPSSEADAEAPEPAAADQGFDVAAEVKSSLWAAATSAFLGTPDDREVAEAEKKKREEAAAEKQAAEEQVRGAVFDIETIKDDQLDALCHRLYGRVRSRLMSDLRSDLLVHRHRTGKN
ncbi:eCIS core domain-containing protein [Streptomyces sp. IBSNAI002]|uniref:eCIS core domain-containing protein n=1 Tax=Streptomyces sp. IBSNAI002 TaxID=3457500 RepID=UPI003FD4BE4E